MRRSLLTTDILGSLQILTIWRSSNFISILQKKKDSLPLYSHSFNYSFKILRSISKLQEDKTKVDLSQTQTFLN